MKWKYKFWILLALAIFIVILLLSFNTYIAVVHAVIFSILFPLVYYRQFIKK